MKLSIKVGKARYTGKAIVSLFLLILLVYFEIKKGSYLDEILGLLAWLYLAALLITDKIKREDAICVFLLCAVIVIGLISNLNSELDTPFFAILVDVLVETKVLVAFFATKYFLDDRTKASLMSILLPLAKIFILFAAFFAILSQFVDTGMAVSERFGIREFVFVFSHNFQLLAVTLLAVSVVSTDKKKGKMFFYLCACITQILAVKIASLLFGCLFFAFLIYFKRNRTIKLRMLIVAGVAIVVLGMFQINAYLLDVTAPRYLLIRYGAHTANRYFPFGAGFATYGSDQAYVNYSQLYYEYGFHWVYGLSPTYGAFINDTFWAMAVGQFGWLGAGIYLSVYVIIYISIFRQKDRLRDEKALLHAGFIQYMVHGVGSAVLSSSSGMIGFIALAMVLTYCDYPQNDRKRIADI